MRSRDHQSPDCGGFVRAVVVLGVIVGLGGCSSSTDDSSVASGSTTAATTTSAGVLPPVASAEVPAAQSTTTEPIATDPPPVTTPGAEVVVTVLAWNDLRQQVEAGAYVPGQPQDGAICALRLTRGRDQVEASASALPDAAATSCGDLAVPRAELASGIWVGQVEYSHDGTVLSSSEIEVQVP